AACRELAPAWKAHLRRQAEAMVTLADLAETEHNWREDFDRRGLAIVEPITHNCGWQHFGCVDDDQGQLFYYVKSLIEAAVLVGDEDFLEPLRRSRITADYLDVAARRFRHANSQKSN